MHMFSGRQGTQKELRMSNLEDVFDAPDSTQNHTSNASSNGVTDINKESSNSQFPATTTPNSKWRPFGMNFKVPVWRGSKPASRTNSESRLSIASSVGTDEDPAGELAALIERRSSIFGSGPGTRTPADSNTSFETDDRSTVPSISSLTARFASLVIPGNLADAEQTTLKTTIDELQLLQRDVLRYLDTNDLDLRERARTLLESIVEEIAVYGEFLESGDRLSDLGITRAAYGDESYEFISTGPRSRIPDELRSMSSQTDSPSEISSEASPLPTPPPIQSPRPLSHLRRSSISTSASNASISSSTIPSTTAMSASNLSVLAGPTVPPGPKDVLRWIPLRILATQLLTAAMRQKVGVPTALAISGGILIGTSRGVVLVYDFAQVLKAILGDPTDESNRGSVTSIALGPDHNKLACGYAYGVIRIWDLQRRTVLRTIMPRDSPDLSGPKADGHDQGASIIHLAFVGSKGAFVSGDNQGSAFFHPASKMLAITAQVSTRIHPSNPNSSVSTALYALTALPGISGHIRYPGDQLHLIAISTPYKMAIMSMKPTPQTQFKVSWTRTTKSSTNETNRACPISCLAWCPPLKKEKDGKVVGLTDPFLACSFGKHLRIIRVGWVAAPKRNKRESVNPKAPAVEYVVQGNWAGEENIVALQWIDDKLLLCLTSSQHLLLFDVTAMKVVERADVRMRHIVSSDYFSQSLKSLEVVPALAYFQSMKAFKGRLFILGEREVVVASRLSWTDRLKALVISGNFQEAIALGLKFYNGSAKQAVTGLPADDSMRRSAVGDHLADLLLTFIDMSLNSYDASDRKHREGEDLSVYSQLATTAFDTCLGIDRDDLLFGDIYDQFCNIDLQGVFLELLEMYILDERITTFSNPVIVRDFFDYYEKNRWFDRLEQVILHLDPSGLDVHRTVGICLRHGLYSALFYVYNRVGDFVTPVIDVLKIIGEHEQPIEEDAPSANGRASPVHSLPQPHTIGDAVYTLYVYLSYVLTGKSFPVGLLDEREAIQAKEDLYSFLFSPFYAIWPPGGNTCKLGEEPYPYIRLLFRSDPGEFLKAVGVVLIDEALESKELKIRQNVFVADGDGLGRFADRYEICRQFVLDGLFAAVEGSDAGTMSIFDAEKGKAKVNGTGEDERNAVVFYAFAARVYARYIESIKLPDNVLRRIILSLLMVTDNETYDERQKAILSILSTGYEPSKTNAEQDKLLDLYETAGMWRAYELTIRRLGRYHLVVKGYLRDPERNEETFDATRGLLESDELSSEQHQAVKKSFIEDVATLVGVDEVETAAVVSRFWPAEHKTIIQSLNDQPDVLFKYLKGLLDPEWALSLRDKDSTVRDSIIRRHRTTTIDLSGEVYEQYIELLCINAPGEVKRYLVRLSKEQAGYPYAFDRVLNVCKKHEVFDAAVWVLEKSGNLEGALTFVLDDVKRVVEEVRNEGVETENLDALGRIQQRVDMAMELCTRSSERVTREESEALWFQLLRGIAEPQKTVAPPSPTKLSEDTSVSPTFDQEISPKQQALHDLLKQSVRTILYAMVGQVSLPSLLYHIVESQRRATFGDHREIIFSMLDSYTYERELFAATNRILSTDVHASQKRMTHTRQSALRPAKGQCGVCRRMLHIRAMSDVQKVEKLVVVKCGHAFHSRCLWDEMERVVEMEGWEGSLLKEQGFCVVCVKTSGRAKAAAKRKVESAGRTSKGKEKMIISEAAEELPLEPDDKLDSKLGNADLFDRLSSQRPASTIYSLLTPTNSYNPEDLASTDEIIDHGDRDTSYAYASYGEDSIHRASEFGSTHQLRYLPAEVVSNAGKYALKLAPPPIGDGDGV